MNDKKIGNKIFSFEKRRDNFGGICLDDFGLFAPALRSRVESRRPGVNFQRLDQKARPFFSDAKVFSFVKRSSFFEQSPETL